MFVGFLRCGSSLVALATTLALFPIVF